MTFNEAVIALARRKSGADVPGDAWVHSSIGGEEWGTEFTPEWHGRVYLLVRWSTPSPYYRPEFASTYRLPLDRQWEATYDSVPELWEDLMPEPTE